MAGEIHTVFNDNQKACRSRVSKKLILFAGDISTTGNIVDVQTEPVGEVCHLLNTSEGRIGWYLASEVQTPEVRMFHA
ncbi:hypothetical protein PABG_00804 [Paracoccidioides brasiliensis Pb03]|uniref:Uncharacterized protein n=1 Tax=Paracoccidioides brasiliensis (strain Pb18) TaxID=502780 RepID=A0A0A0HVI6_PARBD|nr:uncharacterized protein PADG_11572 [Paracoccidioides brasiliensis Pb18]EEH18241.1 hypothetical protein PABG_00804 [Paracoccidioides brasiliensis Pb03]KGM92373.1 hypothetical protein PADG_11572 [Paracoccidioides brasiliensis Pb18]ODH47117.1 hypothetical protein GX48_06771 [Paracoccidioides brasiliensis]